MDRLRAAVAPFARRRTLADATGAPRPAALSVLCVLLNAVFLLLALPTWLLAQAVTPLPATAGTAVALARGVRFVARSIVFPGSLALSQRDCERDYARSVRRQLSAAVDAAQELLAHLQAPSLSQRLPEVMRATQSAARAREALAYYAGVLQLAGAGDDASAAAARALRGSVVALVGELDGLLQGAAPRESLGAAVSAAQAVQAALPLLGPAPKTAESKEEEGGGGVSDLLRRYLAARRPLLSAGSFGMMRADTMTRCGGEQVWVESADGTRVDCLFVAAAGGDPAGPTALFCNPNGGYYELHPFQTDWLHTLTSLGVNVMLWNYRGYGRSEGTPSPDALVRDGEAVLEHLWTARGVRRVAAVGESIGGVVACALADACRDRVSLLIADRTFCNLNAAAERLVAPWAGDALAWILWWDSDNVSRFLRAPCPKLLANDADDVVVRDGCSLKAGVAVRLVLGDREGRLPKPGGDGGDGLEATIRALADALVRIAGRVRHAFERQSEAAADQRLMRTWMALARIDGGCGQQLGHAAARGLDSVRVWVCALLVYGRSEDTLGRALRGDEPGHSLEAGLAAVAGAGAEEEDADVRAAAGALRAVRERPPVELPAGESIGTFLRIHCGHNANYGDEAHGELVKWLEREGWSVSV